MLFGSCIEISHSPGLFSEGRKLAGLATRLGEGSPGQLVARSARIVAWA